MNQNLFIMLKKLFVICLFFSLINPFKATIHEILVWDGYMQFMPNDVPSVLLGDTIQWLPLDVPSMVHTITSTNIPIGAAPFDEIWQAPADTFFQYIPQVAGFYEYVCTPHISFGMIGSFNVINTGTYVLENNLPKKIIRKINLSGSNTKNEFNRPFFMIYDDGTVEKKLLVK